MQGNEGTRFLFALPPASESVLGELILHARQDTTVLITYPYAVSEEVVVPANNTVFYGVDHAMLRCTEGIEDRGATLTSLRGPFFAHISNVAYSDERDPDSTILRPLPESAEDIFIAGYNNGSTSNSAIYRPKSFYMVAADQEDTNVLVYKWNGNTHALAHNLTLRAHQVFTEDAYYHSGENGWVDFSGSFIRADKPVAVYSGHGSSRIPAELVGSSWL